MTSAKLPTRTELTTTAADDLVHVVDVSDTADDPSGSSRKVKLQNLLPAAVLTGTARAYTRQQNTESAELTDNATLAWDLNTGQNADVTLGGNRTLADPSNMVDGGSYSLVLRQDGTGGRTLSYGSAYKFPGGSAPALSAAAGAVDLLVCRSDGASMLCVLQKAFA